MAGGPGLRTSAKRVCAWAPKAREFLEAHPEMETLAGNDDTFLEKGEGRGIPMPSAGLRGFRMLHNKKIHG